MVEHAVSTHRSDRKHVQYDRSVCAAARGSDPALLAAAALLLIVPPIMCS
jgi:hypothetical protein